MQQITKSFLKLLGAMLLLAIAIIPAVISFGWFADSKTVGVSGQTVSSVGNVEIRATEDGDDISVSVATADMTHLSNGSGGSVRPGSTGEFVFYVNNPTQTDYSFSFGIDVLNNEFSANEGFLPGTDTAERKKAIDFLNSHIMFFLSLDENGVYRDRIAPGEHRTVHVTGTQLYAVRIYWVWVPWFSKIFSADSGLIEETERIEIARYYTENEAQKQLIFHDGNDSEQGYNEADYIIGTTVKRICYNISVRGE